MSSAAPDVLHGWPDFVVIHAGYGLLVHIEFSGRTLFSCLGPSGKTLACLHYHCLS